MTHPDLVDGIVRSCWLVEAARAHVYELWGFDEHADRTRRRIDLAREAVEQRKLELPTDLVEPHAEWLTSVVGHAPDAAPLGPALVGRFGEWTNVYLVDHLPSDPANFISLGEAEMVFPIPPRPLEEHEAFLPAHDLPDPPRFVVLTDTHVGAPGTADVLRVAVREIDALEPEFVVMPGDITEDGEPDQFALAREILGQIRAPVHAVLGNHDAVRRSTRTGDGAKHFADAFGAPPDDVVLTCGGLQVALIDTSDPTPSPFPDWDLGRSGTRPDAGGVPGGTLHPGQVERLTRHLDPDAPVLVVQHHELQPFTGFPPIVFGLGEDASRQLVEGLGGERLAGVIAGHTHRSALTDPSVRQLEIPSLKDWPYCYTVVGVRDGRPHAVVRQIGDAGLVWKRARDVPPIYTRYVNGPSAALDLAL